MANHERSDQHDSALKQMVTSVLQPRLHNLGFRDLDITAGEDFEGDEALYIDVYIDLVQPALDPEPFNFLTTVVREALERVGEYRFPHLRYHFDEQQKVVGWR